jgi:hypothetical protein
MLWVKSFVIPVIEISCGWRFLKLFNRGHKRKRGLAPASCLEIATVFSSLLTVAAERFFCILPAPPYVSRKNFSGWRFCHQQIKRANMPNSTGIFICRVPRYSACCNCLIRSFASSSFGALISMLHVEPSCLYWNKCVGHLSFML